MRGLVDAGNLAQLVQQLDTANRVRLDSERGLIKINPLYDWTRDHAVAFTREHAVPVNELHGRGFLSIGCAPCTRAIQPGEPERAGRWWWEDEGKTECGLHANPLHLAARAKLTETHNA